jgi:hypothetical protein
MTEEKRFLVKDHSGRGIAVTLPLSDIRERWDMDFSNDPENEFEDTLGDWMENADVGDTFFNQEDHVSFTRVD